MPFELFYMLVSLVAMKDNTAYYEIIATMTVAEV